MLADLRSRLDALATSIPDIIVGDFNTVRGGAAIATFAPKMRNAFDIAGVGFGATYPRIFPLLHIDQILLGPRVIVLHYEIIDTGSGAHRMQIASILVSEKPD
jgi:endonuclease/exonuclease/phosphatase family metal-dependent hydrolase